MATILKFDPATRKVLNVWHNVSQKDYEGRPNILIDPIIPDGPWNRMTVVGTEPNLNVERLPKSALDAMDAEEAAANTAEAQRQNKIQTANAVIESLKGVSNLSQGQVENAVRAFIALKTMG